MGLICLQRNTVTADHKLVYWAVGLLSSVAIFVEAPARRSGMGMLDSVTAQGAHGVCATQSWPCMCSHAQRILFS